MAARPTLIASNTWSCFCQAGTTPWSRANAGSSSLIKSVIEVAAGITAPQEEESRARARCTALRGESQNRDLEGSALKESYSQKILAASYLTIDTYAGGSDFPRGVDKIVESDPSVAPVHLAMATDDSAYGHEGKRSHFGFRDGRKVTT